MKYDYQWQFQADEWRNGKTLAVDLTIAEDQFEGKFKALQSGALGRLQWTLESVRVVDDRLAENVHVFFSFDASGNRRQGEGRSPRGYIRIDGSRQRLLDRRIFDAELRFEVMGGRGFTSRVASPVYLVRFLRPVGTHTLGIDFGTAASCVALKPIREDVDPQLQRLETGSDGTLYRSSIWVMDGSQAATRKNTQTVVLGGSKLALGFGEKNLNLATLKDPGHVVSSLKRMIEVPSMIWRNYGVPDHQLVAMPGLLLWGYLNNLFQSMIARNRRLWSSENPPLIENVVVTVPNKAGHAFIGRLKAAVLNAINECREGEPLVESWEVRDKSIYVLRESDAAAAEFVFRHRREGGLGQVKEGQKASLVVFDMGAGTCDSSLTLYERVWDADANNRRARMTPIARNGLQIGGDKLDEVIARTIFKELEGQPLNLSAETYRILFDEDKPADDEGEDLMVDLEGLGFFGSYRSLNKDMKDKPERLSELQGLRTAFKFLAGELKIAIADGFYGRGRSEIFEIEFPPGVTPADTRRLKREIVAVAEDDALPVAEKERRISEALDTLRDHFERCEMEYRTLEIGPHLKMVRPLRLPLRGLLKSTDFQTYLRQISSEFINDLLDGAPTPENAALHVILTGRLLAFPLIQEDIVYQLVKRPETERLRFPNKRYDAPKLKQSVVVGAIYARDEGLDFNRFSARLLTNICLYHWDQAKDQPKLFRLVAEESDFQPNGDGGFEAQGRAPGVRLRRNPKANEILRIYEIDKLNWTDEGVVDEFAADLKYNMHRVTPLFIRAIASEGDFEKDDDRFVDFSVQPDGKARVSVFPSTIHKAGAKARDRSEPKGGGRAVNFTNESDEALRDETESAGLGFPL